MDNERCSSGPCTRRITSARARVLRLVTVGAALLGAVLVTPAVALADACPNEQLRSENGSLNLPDCRAYELVSPPESGGTDADGWFLNGLAPVFSTDDQHVVYTAAGSFGGSALNLLDAYEATRTSAGWQTVNLDAADPGPEAPTITAGYKLLNVSSDDSRALFDIPFALESGGANVLNVYGREPDGTFSLQSLGEGPASEQPSYYVGSSADASEVLFETKAQLTSSDTHSFGEELYDRQDGETSLVGILPGEAVPRCGAILGDGAETTENAGGGTEVTNAVSEDGSRVFFESPDWQTTYGGTPAPDPSCEEPDQLYVRVNRSTTIDVSESQRGTPDPDGPQPVHFMGASRDGSKVFFITTGELTEDDSAHDSELYEYDLESKHLTRISAGVSGTAEGKVLGVMGISGDGSHVYFVAEGQLTPEAIPGASNIYVWGDGQLELVSSSAAPQNAIQYDMPSETVPTQSLTSRVTPDGEHLLFTSHSNLTSYNAEGRQEVYEYDASDESITCDSCNPAGTPPTGEAELVRAGPGFERYPTTISEDGQRVFFETTEALVPLDENDAADVYEYEDGHLYLISSGTEPHGSTVVAASANGDDVLFLAHGQLSAQPASPTAKLYDARVGGGFPAPAAPPSCSGDICQGPAAPVPPLLAAGTETVFADGNVAPSVKKPVAGKPKVASKKKKKKCPRQKHPAKKGKATRCKSTPHKRTGHTSGRTR